MHAYHACQKYMYAPAHIHHVMYSPGIVVQIQVRRSTMYSTFTFVAEFSNEEKFTSASETATLIITAIKSINCAVAILYHNSNKHARAM